MIGSKIGKILPLLLMLLTIHAWGKNLVEIEGDYLLYSYDFNYLYGKGNIRLTFRNFVIRAEVVEISIGEKLGRLSRDCTVEFDGKVYRADVLDFDLEKGALRSANFGERVETLAIPTEGGQTESSKGAMKEFQPLSWDELKKSFVYFLNKKVEIRKNYSVHGRQTTVFIEGIQSVSIRKFRLDKGIEEKSEKTIRLNKIWYYPSQGIVVNTSLDWDKNIRKSVLKNSTSLEFQYDLFGNNAPAPRSRTYFSSLHTLQMPKNEKISLNLNYISSNMLNAALAFTLPLGKKLKTEWLADYRKPDLGREELWLRFHSTLSVIGKGSLLLKLGYEKRNQNTVEVTYDQPLVKNVRLLLHHMQSRLLFGTDRFNRLANSSASLFYSTKIFSLASEYSLNRDLLNNQSQANPQVRLNLNPFSFYQGLLKANFSSQIMINQLTMAGHRESLFRANLAMSVDSEAIQVRRGTELSFSLAMEQYIDRDPLSNFTTAGYLIRGKQDLFGVAAMELQYNYQSRRQTRSWLISGTHSQDVNAVFRLKERASGWINGWVALSYDSKTGRFSTGYIDGAIALSQNWRFQTQMNYDFFFRNFHYDFFLSRRAGRFLLRVSYRSLSRQFLFEFLPV
jgi:hypothetical protein